MKLRFLVFVPVLLLAGCGPSYLLDKAEILRIHSRPSATTSTIYYSKTFTTGSSDNVAMKTHSIVRVGENIRSIPELLAVYDGSMERLEKFQARVLHASGSAETYGTGDLSTYALSNRNWISESRLKYLPIEKQISPGDLIETVSIHDVPLRQLGLSFSLSEAGSRAENIECSIVVPPGDSVYYAALNDSISPSIQYAEGQKTYRFFWPSYSLPGKRFAFEQRNRSPLILASIASRTSAADSALMQWQRFGDWYLKLIDARLGSDETLAAKARELTSGKHNPREKIEAIASFCQENVRYEQVYLEHGEFIPNDANVVFARKYGDCKDYAVLMYAMAHAVGLDPHLALVTRGQGYKFCPDIAVTQFNHMLLYYSDGSRDYWYDGTNRAGKPGITADDLINATALVLEPSATRLVRIAEAPENLLSIKGRLVMQSDGLGGDLTVELNGQYAIGFLAGARLEAAKHFEQGLIDWCHEHLNSALIIQQVHWQSRDTGFTFTARCTLPNGLIQIPPAAYLRFSTLFPKLTPEDDPSGRPNDVFYFPGYGHVKAAIEFPEFRDSTSVAQPGMECRQTLEYHLPCGPFDKQGARSFVGAYAQATAQFTAAHKMFRKDEK